MLHTMRNIAISGNSLVASSINTLRERLPPTWEVSVRKLEPGNSEYTPDAILEVKATDGSYGTIAVEAKTRLNAAAAVAMVGVLSEYRQRQNVNAVLLVSGFLTPTTRSRLRDRDISYLDMTGNLWLLVNKPAIFIESEGAERDPSPVARQIRSLKGGAAARIVRALCDWRPPLGVRQLAQLSETNAGYVTRILQLLEREDVISRETGGAVADIRWKNLIHRWAQDYSVVGSNRAVFCLAPRGVDKLVSELRQTKATFALTGSRAVPREAVVAPSRMLSCYVETAEASIEQFGLRNADAGANVILLEPFDQVIWERTRIEDGLTYVGYSQCAVDLLTSTGREPGEGEALMDWMEENESAWRA